MLPPVGDAGGGFGVWVGVLVFLMVVVILVFLLGRPFVLVLVGGGGLYGGVTHSTLVVVVV